MNHITTFYEIILFEKVLRAVAQDQQKIEDMLITFGINQEDIDAIIDETVIKSSLLSSLELCTSETDLQNTTTNDYTVINPIIVDNSAPESNTNTSEVFDINFAAVESVLERDNDAGGAADYLELRDPFAYAKFR